jgi:hypothetical protein
VAWALAASAQQRAMPVVAYINGGTRATTRHLVAAFVKGVSQTGYVEGCNVTVEYFSRRSVRVRCATVVVPFADSR